MPQLSTIVIHNYELSTISTIVQRPVKQSNELYTGYPQGYPQAKTPMYNMCASLNPPHKPQTSISSDYLTLTFIIAHVHVARPNWSDQSGTAARCGL